MEKSNDAIINTDVLKTVSEWSDSGMKTAIATVIDTWGSSPRPAGSQLGVNERCEMIGSVSGGCIEGAVVKAALEVMEDKKPQILEFGVSNEDAWEVGLACGGNVKVYVEALES